MNMLERAFVKIAACVNRLTDPNRLRQSLLRRSTSAPFSERLEWDAIDRPHYGYGVFHAASQALALGLPGITVIEFGVAGGAGLLCLERHAAEVSRELGVKIQVVGFDLGSGLPTPVDYRDMGYVWQPGFYKMDVEGLRAKLKGAELVLGDVNTTVERWLAQPGRLPIGFLAFDLDYYSSTMAAFRIFEAADEVLLPRAFCYFDDIIGIDVVLSSEHTGELLAIKDYNAAHTKRKIAPIYGLAHKRKLPAQWTELIFIHHSFEHALYNRHIYPQKDLQLPLPANAE